MADKKYLGLGVIFKAIDKGFTKNSKKAQESLSNTSNQMDKVQRSLDGFDIKEFSKAFKNMQADIDGLDFDRMNELSSTFKIFEDSINKSDPFGTLQSGLYKLNDQLINFTLTANQTAKKKSLDNYLITLRDSGRITQEQFMSMSKALGEISDVNFPKPDIDTLNEMNKFIQEQRSYIPRLKSGIDGWSMSNLALEISIDKVNKTFEAQEKVKSINKYRLELQNLHNQGKIATKDFQKISEDLNKLSDAFVKRAKDPQSYFDKMKISANFAKNMFSGITKSVVDFSKALIANLPSLSEGLIGKGEVSELASKLDFLKTKMSLVMNTGQAQTFQNTMQEILRTSGMTADQAGELANNMNRFGVSVDESRQLMPFLGKLVGRMGLDAGQVAEMGGQLNRTLGMSVSESEELVGQFYEMGKARKFVDFLEDLPAITKEVTTSFNKLGIANSKVSQTAIKSTGALTAMYRKMGIEQKAAVAAALKMQQSLTTMRNDITRLSVGLDPENFEGMIDLAGEITRLTGKSADAAFNMIQKGAEDPQAFLKEMMDIAKKTTNPKDILRFGAIVEKELGAEAANLIRNKDLREASYKAEKEAINESFKLKEINLKKLEDYTGQSGKKATEMAAQWAQQSVEKPVQFLEKMTNIANKITDPNKMKEFGNALVGTVSEAEIELITRRKELEAASKKAGEEGKNAASLLADLEAKAKEQIKGGRKPLGLLIKDTAIMKNTFKVTQELLEANIKLTKAMAELSGKMAIMQSWTAQINEWQNLQQSISDKTLKGQAAILASAIEAGGLAAAAYLKGNTELGEKLATIGVDVRTATDAMRSMSGLTSAISGLSSILGAIGIGGILKTIAQFLPSLAGMATMSVTMAPVAVTALAVAIAGAVSYAVGSAFNYLLDFIPGVKEVTENEQGFKGDWFDHTINNFLDIFGQGVDSYTEGIKESIEQIPGRQQMVFRDNAKNKPNVNAPIETQKELQRNKLSLEQEEKESQKRLDTLKEANITGDALKVAEDNLLAIKKEEVELAKKLLDNAKQRKAQPREIKSLEKNLSILNNQVFENKKTQIANSKKNEATKKATSATENYTAEIATAAASIAAPAIEDSIKKAEAAIHLIPKLAAEGLGLGLGSKSFNLGLGNIQAPVEQKPITSNEKIVAEYIPGIGFEGNTEEDKKKQQELWDKRIALEIATNDKIVSFIEKQKELTTVPQEDKPVMVKLFDWFQEKFGAEKQDPVKEEMNKIMREMIDAGTLSSEAFSFVGNAYRKAIEPKSETISQAELAGIYKGGESFLGAKELSPVQPTFNQSEAPNLSRVPTETPSMSNHRGFTLEDVVKSVLEMRTNLVEEIKNINNKPTIVSLVGDAKKFFKAASNESRDVAGVLRLNGQV